MIQIFTSFVTVAVFGFGGTMPWSRRMLVDIRKWMTAEEYNEAFAFCQFLPGPNIINLAIVFGEFRQTTRTGFDNTTIITGATNPGTSLTLTGNVTGAPPEMPAPTAPGGPPCSRRPPLSSCSPTSR